MAFYKRASGAWVSSAPRKRVSGSMVAATSLLVRSAGAWVQKLAITVGLTRGQTNGMTTATSWTSPSVTAIPEGGDTYTYAWSWLSNTGGLTINNPATATVSFTRAGLVIGVTYSGTARCTVTSGGLTAFADHDVQVTRNNPV